MRTFRHKGAGSLFWEGLDLGQIPYVLMDALSDTLIYVKDSRGSYMFVNAFFAKTIQQCSEDILGKNDLDLFGQELASVYMDDDSYVMKTRELIKDKPELVTHRPGVVRWYLTTKAPLLNKKDEVVGLAGVSRLSQVEKREGLMGPMSSVKKAVEYIYKNSDRMVSVNELASICGQSISTLERRFREHFRCSPARFVAQTRLSRACELLAEPSYAISEVSEMLGYSDPVVFSRIFKREMRVSPKDYRRSLSSCQ